MQSVIWVAFNRVRKTEFHSGWGLVIFILQHRERRQEEGLLRKREPWRSGIPPDTNTSDCFSICWSRRFCPPLLTLPRMAHMALGESLEEISRRRAFAKYQSDVKAVEIFRHITFHYILCEWTTGQRKEQWLPESNRLSTAGTKATCTRKKCEICWNLLLSLTCDTAENPSRITQACKKYGIFHFGADRSIWFCLYQGRYSTRLRGWAFQKHHSLLYYFH